MLDKYEPQMMLGHYRIIEKVGEGGMGAVYRAEDTRLGRTVAIKVLSSDRVGDTQRRARFLQAARKTAQNIVIKILIDEQPQHAVSIWNGRGPRLSRQGPPGQQPFAHFS